MVATKIMIMNMAATTTMTKNMNTTMTKNITTTVTKTIVMATTFRQVQKYNFFCLLKMVKKVTKI